MMDELRELYQEVILDHGRRPRNFRRPDDATCEAKGDNPLCGDRLAVFLAVDDDAVIRDVGFVGKGCAISVASASLKTEIGKGKTGDQATARFGGVQTMCAGDDPAPPPDDVADEIERLQVLSGVRQFPVRVKCATLAWHTMKAAMNGVAEVSTED